MADGLLAELASRVAHDRRAVLVTVAHTTGSAPRAPGAAMVVGLHDTFGTIGGGHLEFEAIRLARDALAHDNPPAPWLVRFPLAARLGQCCGGVATLAFAVVVEDAWVDTAVACERTGATMAIVSRIGAGNDRKAHMVVTADHAAGSLGDAALDSAAVGAARPRIAAGKDDCALVASTTGDGSTLLVHTVVPCDFRVLVFGNGHVGRALVHVLGALPANVRWVDARDADFPSVVPANVEVVATDLPEAELNAAPHGAYVVVTTHNHALDLVLVTAAFARDDWRYLGLIGSASKRNQFEKRLLARGFTPERLAFLTCPMGRSGGLAIRSKEPGAIAVAVAAEILALRERQETIPVTALTPAPHRRAIRP